MVVSSKKMLLLSLLFTKLLSATGPIQQEKPTPEQIADKLVAHACHACQAKNTLEYIVEKASLLKTLNKVIESGFAKSDFMDIALAKTYCIDICNQDPTWSCSMILIESSKLVLDRDSSLREYNSLCKKLRIR